MVAIRKYLSAADVLVRQNRNGGDVRTPRAQSGALPPRVRVVAPTPTQPAPTQAAAPAVATPAPAVVAATPTPAVQAGITEADVVRIVGAALAASRAEQPAVDAPAVHLSPARTIRDLELIALDNGMTDEQVSQWRAARQGDLPQVPTGHRFKSSGGRQQFRNMRGGRNFGTRFANNPSQLGLASGPDEDVGGLFCAYAGYMAKAAYASGRKCDAELAFRMAKRDGADPLLVRILGESTMLDGGVLVPEQVIESYIELLYASSIYLQGQPLRLQVARGKVTMPRVATGATTGWIGETAVITVSQEAFDDVSLNLRKLGVVVPFSNDLARHSMASIEEIIRADITENASVTIDTAMIRGLGTASQPRGLANEVLAANSTAQTGTTIATITTDTARMMRLQMNQNVKGTKWFWMFAPRTLMGLWSARDANNNLVWQNELNSGTFNGRPYGVTTSIPINLGAGGDSETYLVDYSHEMYGEGIGDDGYQFEVRDGVAYNNAGTIVSAFSQDLSVARLIQKVDRAGRQNGKHISLLTGVTIA